MNSLNSPKLTLNRDYAAKVFGFATFGKVYGLIICLAGLCNFAQSGLDALTHGAFDGDPIPVNLMLLFVALAVGCALVGFVWKRSQTMERGFLEDRAEHAREVEVPNGLDSATGDRDVRSSRYGGVETS